jgi:hypothetical protein
MYKGQSKKQDLQPEKVSENFRKLRKEITTLTTLNESKRQELMNMSNPYKVPELMGEPKYKNNDILMKLPEFVKNKNNLPGAMKVSPTKEVLDERGMVIRLGNIEEEAHSLENDLYSPSSDKMRKTGLGIIKDWDKELERL